MLSVCMLTGVPPSRHYLGDLPYLLLNILRHGVAHVGGRLHVFFQAHSKLVGDGRPRVVCDRPEVYCL